MTQAMSNAVVEEHPIEALDDDRIEKSLEDKRIGDQIRRLRLKRSMGLVELGRLTGLSASFLSQLETGRVVPTLRNLARISLAFNKDISFFFPPAGPTVFRRLDKANRVFLTRKQKQNATFISESMSTLIPDRQMVPCLAEFHPNGEEVEFTPRVFAGTEFIYVIEGALEIHATNQHHLLAKGDVCWIDATTSRRYLCAGAACARVIIITEHTNR